MYSILRVHFTPVLKSYGCVYACVRVQAQVDSSEAQRRQELGQLQLHQPRLGRTLSTVTRHAAPAALPDSSPACMTRTIACYD